MLEKGPYELRFFPRAQALGPVQEIERRTLVNHHKFLMSDTDTGDTNQIIISLDYNQSQRIKELISGQGVVKSPVTRPALERQFVQALEEKVQTLSKIMAFPKHVKFIFDSDRMSDELRVQGEKGQLIQERLERYILLTYESIDAARKALVLLQTEKSLSSVGMNKSNMVFSFSPNDSYFLPTAVSNPKKKISVGITCNEFPRSVGYC